MSDNSREPQLIVVHPEGPGSLTPAPFSPGPGTEQVVTGARGEPGGRSEGTDTRDPAAAPGGAPEDNETVERPAKVMRIGSMIRQLLEEVRQSPLDEPGRRRLREIYDTSLSELQEGLSPDLRQELVRMAPAFHPETVPSESELRVAQAQLVGWLEGLFHGIQATLYAQQMAQRAQMEEAKRRGLPSGRLGGDDHEDRPMPGTYL
ncbi:MAG TPA: proteasome activator [Acidimicrobiales bacterium]|nr:proteasome activator [Acidimicrobiales bacterium]